MILDNTVESQPKTTKLSPNKEAQINERRKNYSLYAPKISVQIEEKPKSLLKKPQLEQFLDRNYVKYRERLQNQDLSAENFKIDQEECTFKPQINEYSRQLMDKEKLNYIGRNKLFLENKDNNIRQKEYHKQRNELQQCSFQPNLNPNIQEDQKKFLNQQEEQKFKKELKIMNDKILRKTPHKIPVNRTISPRPQNRVKKQQQQEQVKSFNGQINIVEQSIIDQNQMIERENQFISFELEKLLQKNGPIDINDEFLKVENELDNLFKQLDHKKY